MHRIEPFDGALQLSGFNNLTKSLSFNLYDFCVARNEYERRAYVDYIHERFNAAKVTKILTEVCNIIEAKILAVSDQAYEPWGASSLILMSDLKGSGIDDQDNLTGNAKNEIAANVSMHLDKSHICAHTYPDFRASGTVCSFRIDIDISTCGEISPLKALNYLCSALDNDVIVMDYVVRGYTRDAAGKRIYIDHILHSIQDYIDPEFLKDYHCVDLALQSDNIWQTKMLRTNLDEQSYFLDPVDLSCDKVQGYLDLVKKEMRGLLYMWPD